MKNEEQPIVSLTCCCCGEATKGRQWYNRDTGFGLCAKCATWIPSRGKTSPEEMLENYGIKGVNYCIEIPNSESDAETGDEMSKKKSEKKSDSPLNPTEFTELLDFVQVNQKNDPPVERGQLALLLMQYEKKYSLRAMYRYLHWALKNGQPIASIRVTITHDLNGFMNNESFFEPRSASY